MKYTLLHKDPSSRARLGRIDLADGRQVQTPVFMPVGTCGALKGMGWPELSALGCEIALANTYHMHLRPGEAVVSEAGGLRGFTQWPGAFLTDSGGFQVFSLAALRKINDEGVTFRSHIDGRSLFIGPVESMKIQKALGADICMAFDQCVPCPCPREQALDAMRRTSLWLKMCKEVTLQSHQNLFGIVQGAGYLDLRKQHLEEVCSLDLPGYAIGGLSVGEPAHVMYEVLDAIADALPMDKPRYLMGVGTPRNLIESVMRGVDMFDCVMPSRNGRNGTLFTWEGKLSIKAARYARDMKPIDSVLGAACYASNQKRAYVRHLIKAGEHYGRTLACWQNIAFYLDLMAEVRTSIAEGTLNKLYERVVEIYPD